MKSLTNLINALAAFMEANWLPYEDSIGSVNWSITNGTINKEKLVSEYLAVTSELGFDWKNLSTESQLLITPENYSNEDIKNYINFLLQDYLFPEKAMADKEIENLSGAVERILGEYKLNDGWMYSYDLFDELKKQELFKNLEYYNLWKLPFVKKRILQKCIENKDREIGHLKYNDSPI
ncbi:hypothetical protein ACNQGB_13840 [Flavobacterium sp. XS1P32]|uniref:hypothetical protein n=1 Tax=unclassified Flavobacterium TaxID=196869 RepID=UPI003AAB3D3C